MCHKTLQEMQMILDNEYEEKDLKKALDHINSCSICKQKFENLKNQDYLLRQIMEHNMQIPSNTNMPTIKRKEVFYMNKKAKRFASVAAVFLIGLSLFTFEPIKAIADDFFKTFRAEKVESVSITSEELNEIADVFEKGSGKIDLEGIVSVEGASQEKSLEFNNFEDAKEKMPSLKYPKNTGDFKLNVIEYNPSSSFEMTLDADKFNDFVEYLGSTSKVSSEISDKPITLNTNESIFFDLENSKGKYINICQTDKPTIKIPNDLDEKEIVNALIDTGLIPNDLKNILCSLDELAIPVVYDENEQTKEDINIDGAKGYIIKNNDGSYVSAFLVKDGVIYLINSNINANDLKTILKGMDF